MDSFSQPLLIWFDQYGRQQLPWQQQPTPYKTWVSEIMLQQTQVNTVIPYYLRFIENFPTVQILAQADLNEVLHLWTGLGYYARARHLHRAAQQVVAHWAGELPDNLSDLMQLPGIGRSTAGAILALAFAQRQPILDGNVKRILCRYHALEGWTNSTVITQKLWQLAEQHLPEQRIAAYTQAIMDLGAMICTRATPKCARCPLNRDCIAYQTEQTHRYPTPKPRKRLPIKAVTFIMLHHQTNGVLLEQRPTAGVWGGLWSFPECATVTEVPLWYQHCFNHQIPTYQTWQPLRHTFTHFYLDITPVYIHITDKTCQNREVSTNQCWHSLTQPQVRGLAIPVVRLLKQITQLMKG